MASLIFQFEKKNGNPPQLRIAFAAVVKATICTTT